MTNTKTMIKLDFKPLTVDTKKLYESFLPDRHFAISEESIAGCGEMLQSGCQIFGYARSASTAVWSPPATI